MCQVVLISFGIKTSKIVERFTLLQRLGIKITLAQALRGHLKHTCAGKKEKLTLLCRRLFYHISTYFITIRNIIHYQIKDFIRIVGLSSSVVLRCLKMSSDKHADCLVVSMASSLQYSSRPEVSRIFSENTLPSALGTT